MANNNLLEITNNEKLIKSFMDDIRGLELMPSSYVIFFVYTLILLKKDNCKNADDLKAFLKKDSKKYLIDEKNLIDENKLKEKEELILNLLDTYSLEDLEKIVLHDYINYQSGMDVIETPNSIIDLVLKLFNVKEKDSVADFGCGRGKFLLKAFDANNNVSFYGNEINTSEKKITQIRSEILNSNFDIRQEDMFDIEDNLKFDKIFSNYPLGMKIKSMPGAMRYAERVKENNPDLKLGLSVDWLFNYLLVDKLKDNGKAIGILSNGSTWNNTDQSIRKYFIENGFIEAVVSLPEKLLEYTSIPVTLIILSKGNKNIRIVDATEIYCSGRRQNYLTDKDIQKIVDGLSLDSEFSKSISIKDLEENDFAINPSRYLAKELVIKNGAKFESIIRKITRGVAIKASEMDELVSKERTNMQYLKLSNIQNGIVDSELPYIKEIDEKYNKYLIKNNSLIISKNGKPFKIAVVNVENGKSILGNGNIYIIELYEEKVNPYYLKAFFESNLGIKSLNSITVGTTMPNLPVKDLKSLKVPVPSLEKQNEVADKYKEKVDEMKILKARILRKQEELLNIFEENE